MQEQVDKDQSGQQPCSGNILVTRVFRVFIELGVELGVYDMDSQMSFLGSDSVYVLKISK